MPPADYEKHGIPTPFAAPSWEPRFALDAFEDLETLVPLDRRQFEFPVGDIYFCRSEAGEAPPTAITRAG